MYLLSTLLPIILLFLLGAALRHWKFFSGEFALQLNRLTFWVLLPCQLVMEISGAPDVFSGNMFRLAFLILAAGACVIPVALVARRAFCHKADMGVFLQGALRGNIVYVGLPVVCFHFADNAAARQTAVLALALVIPVYNVVSVVLLGLGASKRGQPLQKRLRDAGRGLLTNPLILACLAGVLIKVSGVSLPLFVERAMKGLGNASFAAALLALGMSFTFSRVHGPMLRAALCSSVLRVFGSPLMGLLLGVLLGRWLGLSPDLLLVALLFLATPTAVASFVMAEQMGCDKDLAAAIVLLSTLLSFFALAFVLAFGGA